MEELERKAILLRHGYSEDSIFGDLNNKEVEIVKKLAYGIIRRGFRWLRKKIGI